MQRTEIDGVPVLWDQAPEPFTAALVFGVGARHETFRTVGVTHLVEHLVMGTLPRSPLERNAEVDLDRTVFHATGPEDEVVDFVNRVCRAISDLPLDRVERERGVLEAEGGHAEHPAIALSLRARYGFRGPGLAGTTGPGPRALTREHVADHARRHFIRENAYLVLGGEPPAGLQLDLPAGERVPAPVVPHCPMQLPGRVQGGHFPVAAVSGLVTNTAGTAAGTWTGAILRERLEDELRGRHGVSYEVECSGASISLEEAMPVVWADAHEDRWQLVVETLWGTLNELAEHGPTPAEMEHALATSRRELEDPRGVVEWLAFQATRALYGREPRTRAEQLQLDTAVDASSVQDCARQLLGTAVLLVPDETVDLAGVPDVTEDELSSVPPVDGRRYRRKVLAFAPLDLATHVGDDALSLTAMGHTSRIDWTDVVGVASAPGLREIVAGDGRSLLVVSKYFRNADDLLSDIDKHVGPLLFDADAEVILEN